MNQNFNDLLSKAALAANEAWNALVEASDNAPDEDLQHELRELSRKLGRIDEEIAVIVSAMPYGAGGPSEYELERVELGDYEVHDGLSTGERENIERALTAKEQRQEEAAWSSISASHDSSPK